MIDIHKMPRPERSGIIAVLIMYLTLTGFGDILNAGNMDATDSIWALICYAAPCSLLFLPQPKQVEIKESHPFIYVEFFPGITGSGQKVCTCHLDWKTNGVIEHDRMPEELTCESFMEHFAGPYQDTDWTLLPFGRHGDNSGLDYFRHHCGDTP